MKTKDKQLVQKEKAFILALDGDVDFDPPAFELVLDRCLRNDKVAACCGQERIIVSKKFVILCVLSIFNQIHESFCMKN